jgi:hypothetical protein
MEKGEHPALDRKKTAREVALEELEVAFGENTRDLRSLTLPSLP